MYGLYLYKYMKFSLYYKFYYIHILIIIRGSGQSHSDTQADRLLFFCSCTTCYRTFGKAVDK